MPETSFNRLFAAGVLARAISTPPAPRKPSGVFGARATNENEFRAKSQAGRAPDEGGPATPLSRRLDGRLGLARRFGPKTASGSQVTQASALAGPNARQRAVVKIHYFGHGGGGAAALKAHARYVARTAAAKARTPEQSLEPDTVPEPEQQARAHAAYLNRDAKARSAFYDAQDEGVDGAGRVAAWAHADRRHFRIILAPENGAALGDLKPYVRDVMARAEAALGSRLDWVGVDHWDTDNPHTHIVLRGRRDDGRDLVIPRAFVQHGFRNAARDAATERLGPRTREDERRALAREVRAHRPTRLDGLLAEQVPPDGRVRLSALGAPGDDQHLANALKARARELQRLGLASEDKRGMLRFSPDWRDRLASIELHLDVRKRLVRERTVGQTLERDQSMAKLMRGLLDR